MKLLIIQCILGIIEIILVYIHKTYVWLPFVLMFIPVILLFCLRFNCPVIGLWAARFEFGKKLIRIYLPEKYRIDRVILTDTDEKLWVLHRSPSKWSSDYITWVVKVK